MPLIALTVFLSAFLLFQVQPLIAKYILPWFGGGPAVWSVSMLFFQVTLLAGYAYAHLSTQRLRPRAQLWTHLALLAIALTQLPITPADAWKPTDVSLPTVRILLLLAASIGLPYLVLSSTAPLLQAWFARERPGRAPYRLYALSNLGSLLALVSYPFVVEPALSRTSQATVWSASFGIFVMLSGASALWALGAKGEAPAVGRPPAEPEAPCPTVGVRALWLALSGCAAVLFLAVTNQITTDVAVIPLLWVLPLSLYLLTFIIAFDHERWYVRRWFVVALVPVVAVTVRFMFLSQVAPIPQQLVVYTAMVFIGCMICHGELSRLKPHPRYLTGYFLIVALGGAVGGSFVAVVAPLVFNEHLELHLALMGVAGLALATTFLDEESPLHGGQRPLAWLGMLLSFGVLGFTLNLQARESTYHAVSQSRSFYGVLTVELESEGTPAEHLVLWHGGIAHGVQYTDPGMRHVAIGYHAPGTGVSEVLRLLPRKHDRRIGVVGMGAGTLAAYGRAGDYVRFYEIDPGVRRLADSVFTYLRDSAARIEVVMGDARLSMEREDPQRFDVLFLDAFSGDAIPLHLLTREAFETYERDLAPGGVIALLISTWHLDFGPVVQHLAEESGLYAVRVAAVIRSPLIWDSDWMVMSADKGWIDQFAEAAGALPAQPADAGRLWTDDYTSLFRLLGS